MAKKKAAPEEVAAPEQAENEQAEQTEEAEVADEVAAPAVSAFSVFDDNGKYVRTYSHEIHGQRARELADMYVSGHGGEVKEGHHNP